MAIDLTNKALDIANQGADAAGQEQRRRPAGLARRYGGVSHDELRSRIVFRRRILKAPELWFHVKERRAETTKWPFGSQRDADFVCLFTSLRH